MNIVIGVLAIIITTYIGLLMSKKFTDKKIFYSNFFEFNKTLKNEIKFSQKSIIEIVNQNKNRSDTFNEHLRKVFISKEKNDFTSKFLNPDEITFLLSYVNTIGCSDIKTQSEYLESTNIYLNEKLDSSIKEENKNKKTYIKLGFLVGLIILVILL